MGLYIPHEKSEPQEDDSLARDDTADKWWMSVQTQAAWL